MEPEQLKTFKSYRDHINNIGLSMPIAFESLSKSLHSTKKFRFLLSIIMATELIKIKLRGLIIFDDYINEMRWYLEKNGKYIIKKMNEYSSKSYGQTLAEFCDRYNLAENNKGLYDTLRELNRKRNDIAHDAVLKHFGDLNKADEEIRPYILTQVIDEIQKKLTAMINSRIEIQAEIEKQIRDRGLF